MRDPNVCLYLELTKIIHKYFLLSRAQELHHSCLRLRCMGTPPHFSAIFTRGNNYCDFLFASHDDKNVLERVQLLKEQILSFES